MFFFKSHLKELGPDSLHGNAAKPFWMSLAGTSELSDLFICF